MHNHYHLHTSGTIPHVLTPTPACPAGADGGPLLDEVESSLSAMLAAGLEDAAFSALRANLEGGGHTAAAAAAAATPTTLSLAGMARLGLSPLTGAALGGLAAGARQGGALGAHAAALAEARASAEADERCCLLHILMLIYYHPRKQCPPERFISLAKLLHARLFSRAASPYASPGGDGGAELSPAQLSVKLVSAWGGGGGGRRARRQRRDRLLVAGVHAVALSAPLSPPHARTHIHMVVPCYFLPPPHPIPYTHTHAQGTLLLLEMLDVDQALAALAGGHPVTPDSYAFAAPSVRDAVHAELAAWWPTAAAPHSPVLLAWAAVMCLAARGGDAGPSDSGGSNYGAHAARAHELDALRTLRDLTAHAGPPIVAEMYNNIVLRRVAGWVAPLLLRGPIRVQRGGRSRRPWQRPPRLTSPPILCPSSPCCSTMSAAFAAFDFSPASLPLPQTQLVVATLSNLFRHASAPPSLPAEHPPQSMLLLLLAQALPATSLPRGTCCSHALHLAALPLPPPSRPHTHHTHTRPYTRHYHPHLPLRRDQPALCEGFWAGDRAADEPLRHFLGELLSLFPALPTPLYSLLAALSATADSGATGCCTKIQPLPLKLTVLSI
jgi:nuclear pore complex protein Nup188